jgi:hypothetical protein
MIRYTSIGDGTIGSQFVFLALGLSGARLNGHAKHVQLVKVHKANQTTQTVRQSAETASISAAQQRISKLPQ